MFDERLGSAGRNRLVVSRAGRHGFLCGVVGLLPLLAGCFGSTEPEPSPPILTRDSDGVTIATGVEPSEAQRLRLVAAKEALFTQLSQRLMEAMMEGGPAKAIEVCQREAPQIAASVGESERVVIGRVGVRLRNPKNTAPAWAADWIESRAVEPRFAVLSNQRAAALLPIKLQSQCLVCHGPADQLMPEIKKQLVDRYPQDQATGFQEGELRGWFWVELLEDADSSDVVGSAATALESTGTKG